MILHGRDLDRVEQAARELDPTGARAEAIEGNLSSSEGRPPCCPGWTITGVVDILVNNAGSIERLPTRNVTREDFARLIEVNALSGVQFALELMRPMIDRNDHGRVIWVIWINSEAAIMPQPDMGP